MNILITGVTGLFGSELAREFSALGSIHGLKRASSDLGAVDLEGLDIHWHEGDVLDFNSVLEAVEGMDGESISITTMSLVGCSIVTPT